MVFHDLIKKRHDRKTSELSFAGFIGAFLLMFLIYPLLTPAWGSFFMNITFSFLIFATIFTLHWKRYYLLLIWSLAILAIILNSLTLLLSNSLWMEGASRLTAFGFIGFIAAIHFKKVFFAKTIEINLVFGAICIYVLIGILFALLYSFIDLVNVAAFRGLEDILNGDYSLAVQQWLKLQQLFYFSFVTQTTLGYGDIVPVLSIAKNLAAVQAITGQFYIAILVAGLVGKILRNR